MHLCNMNLIYTALLLVLIFAGGIVSEPDEMQETNSTLPVRTDEPFSELQPHRTQEESLTRMQEDSTQQPQVEDSNAPQEDYSSKAQEENIQPQTQETVPPRTQEDSVAPRTQENIAPGTQENVEPRTQEDTMVSRAQEDAIVPKTQEDSLILKSQNSILLPMQGNSGLSNNTEKTQDTNSSSTTTDILSATQGNLTRNNSSLVNKQNITTENKIENTTIHSTKNSEEPLDEETGLSNRTLFSRAGQMETIVPLTQNASNANISTIEILSIPTTEDKISLKNFASVNETIDSSNFTQSNDIVETKNVTETEEDKSLNQYINKKTETQQGNVNAATSRKQIVLLLQKDCNERDGLPKSLSELNDNLLSLFQNNKDIRVNNQICESYVHLKFIIESKEENTIKKATDLLSKNVTLGEYKILQAIEADANLDTSNLLKVLLVDETENSDELLKQKEIIAYIVAALSAGLLLLIFIVFCCIRCLSRKQTNSLDLCDIPHLNLKVEDYKMNPIPRPSISYQEYGRELLNSTYGRSQSQSEDMILNQHHFTGEVMSSLSNTLRRETFPGRNEMRTFNGKKPCGRVQSMDIRPNHRSNENWMSNSREHLNTDFERRNTNGFDNPTFRRWY